MAAKKKSSSRSGSKKKASAKVARAMHERKAGTLRSGRSGAKVKSRKQAIAIGLSEARAAGAKVPKKKAGAKKKSSAKKAGAKKSTAKKKAGAKKRSSAKKKSSSKR